MNRHPDPNPDDPTSLHARRAVAGERASLSWIVERFTAPLLALAHHRAAAALRETHDPEDLVADVWATTLPRLGDLVPREGRLTPVLMKFLSTTLLGPNAEPLPESRLPDPTLGIVTRAARSEARRRLADALAALDEKDREILFLRGLEQNANATVGMLLGLAPSAVSMRYSRALEKLRAFLPESVFDELGGD
jgi:RNA polymerase sigma factor for flagellar operon FliA